MKLQYWQLSKAHKGIVTRYLMKVTRYSRTQTKRLIQKYHKTGTVTANVTRRNIFKCLYTHGDFRIDSVHQGDQGKGKGVYHINSVDEVTQFQVIVTVERISERFMLTALKLLLDVFPFKTRGFHADNGSEYVNYTVAELLDKLHIEFTKSRSRHSNEGLPHEVLWARHVSRKQKWFRGSQALWLYTHSSASRGCFY